MEKGDYIKIKEKFYKIYRIYNPTIDFSVFIEFEGKEGSYIHGEGYHYRLTKYVNKNKFLFARVGWEGDIDINWIEEKDIILIDSICENCINYGENNICKQLFADIIDNRCAKECSYFKLQFGEK